MKDYSYIHQTCTIRQGQIIRDEAILWNTPDLALSSFLRQAYRALDWSYQKFYKMNTLCQLATLAGRYLLGEKGLAAYEATEIAIVMANAHATAVTDAAHYRTIAAADAYYPRPAVFVYTLPSILIGELSIQYNIKGPSAFFVQPEPDWDFLLGYSQMLLQDPSIKVCLTGWIEHYFDHYHATLHLLTSSPSF